MTTTKRKITAYNLEPGAGARLPDNIRLEMLETLAGAWENESELLHHLADLGLIKRSRIPRRKNKAHNK